MNKTQGERVTRHIDEHFDDSIFDAQTVAVLYGSYARYYRKASAERGDVHRRAQEILRREMARKEARRNGHA